MTPGGGGAQKNNRAKKLRADFRSLGGKTPETLSEFFLEFPLIGVRLATQKPYN